MQKLLFTLICFAITQVSMAQTHHRCGTVELTQLRNNHLSGYKDAINHSFALTKNNTTTARMVQDFIYVPVVVHVVYNTAQQNIADSVVQRQIQILNADFNRYNTDASELRSVFGSVGGSAKIVFYLANTDPSGNPTTGIIHKSTTKTSFSLDILGGSYADLEKVKAAAQGSLIWPTDRYVNIWVCNVGINLFGTVQEGSLLGLATPPTNPLPSIWPAGATDGLLDGLVIYYKVFGDNNPTLASDPALVDVANRGRTTVHEMGHYLGLRHIWADKGNALTGAPACTPYEDDGMSDTPYMGSNSQAEGCSVTKNTCTYETPDLPDMFENYMDYSVEDCQNTFTIEQVGFMRTILENQRIDLTNWSTPPADILNTIVPSSIVSAVEPKQIEIHPNPASEYISINTGAGNNTSVEIYDINGKTVWSKVNYNNERIDVKALSNGMYIIKANTNQINYTGRFIKND